jgi:hypothetical protein
MKAYRSFVLYVLPMMAALIVAAHAHASAIVVH